MAGINWGVRAGSLLGALLLAQTVAAHPGHHHDDYHAAPLDMAHSLAAGFSHPFTGLDHLLAMLAVGIWAVQMGRQALWALPLAFPLIMALGGTMGVYGLGLPGVEIGIAASSLLLGAMVLANVRLQAAWAALIVGALALFHGYAHGAEMPADAGALAYGAGFVAGTLILHVAGMALGSLHRFGAGASALRAIGAGIAGAGALFLVGNMA